MSRERRLRKIEAQILKSQAYIQGMAILEELIQAEETGDKEKITILLVGLLEVQKTAS